MGEKLNWRKAVIISALFHLSAFICLGGLATAKITRQEEILEMALIDDLSLYGQTGSEASQGSGASAVESIALSAPQINPPETSKERSVTETKVMDENIPAENIAAAPNIPAVSAKSLPGNVSGGAKIGIPAENGVGSGTGNSNGIGSGGGISPPAVLSSVKPTYPPAARQKGIEGVVVIRALILENGRAAEASVNSSSGDASLDAAALASISKWRFVPAKNLATGVSVAKHAFLPIRFELN